jgi:hypothetical protein
MPKPDDSLHSSKNIPLAFKSNFFYGLDKMYYSLGGTQPYVAEMKYYYTLKLNGNILGRKISLI